MASILRAVVVQSDAAARAALKRVLAGIPSVTVVGEFASVSMAVLEAPAGRPDVAIVDVGGPEMARLFTEGVSKGPLYPQTLDGPGGTPGPSRPVALLGELQAVLAVEQLTRALAETAIIATGPRVSADFVIRVIRAGAVEFLEEPVERADLIGALGKVTRFRGQSGPARTSGRITAVFSPKGGLGVTTVATNLAVCLTQSGRRSTLLAEFDHRASDVVTFLNLRPTYSVVDAVRNIERMDESFLRALLVRHESGLWVLPAPAQVDPAPLPAGEVEASLAIAASHFDQVVLDLRHDWDPATVAALAVADTLLFLTSLNVSALRAGAAGLAALDGFGVDRSKVRLVLMREGAPEDVMIEQAQDLLGMPITWKVPNDYSVAVSAMNAGRPVVSGAARSKLARNLGQLAATLAPRASRGGDPARPSGATTFLRQAWIPRLFGVG